MRHVKNNYNTSLHTYLHPDTTQMSITIIIN